MRQGRNSRRMVLLALGLLMPLLGLAGCAQIGQVMEQARERGLSVAVIVSVIALIATLVGLYFKAISVMDQTRKEFEARRPDVHLVRAYTISAQGSYAAILKLHNVGKTPASAGTITLDSCPGKAEFHILLPFRPGFNEYEPSIEIVRDSLIRTTRVEGACLWIRYRDQWDYSYEDSYPVLQELGDHGLFNLQIQKEQPRLDRPRLSFWKMRRILRQTPG